MTPGLGAGGSSPRVTVLMSVYNGERFLRPAIESVLDQGYRDLELLIVEDASTDQTPAIIDSYGDPRLRVLSNPRNLGLTRSLNRGFASARANVHRSPGCRRRLAPGAARAPGGLPRRASGYGTRR